MLPCIVIRSAQLTGKAMQTPTSGEFYRSASALCPVGATTEPADAMRVLGNHRNVDLRYKAIVLADCAGAFRRNEVANLRWADITVRDVIQDVIQLRRYKTGQAGRGRTV